MQNPLKLIAFVIIIVAIANLMFGSSALIEQVVNAQNMTENNNTDYNSTNESGSRCPFIHHSLVISRHYSK
jgi:hypothetical protein